MLDKPYLYMTTPVLASHVCATCTAGGAPRQAVKRMQLRNTGDLAARFAWDAASLGPYFSVTPASGQIEAGRELALEVAFRPTSTLADLHAQEVQHTGSKTVPLLSNPRLAWRPVAQEPVPTAVFQRSVMPMLYPRRLQLTTSMRNSSTRAI